MAVAHVPELLWQPTEDAKTASNMAKYQAWLLAERGLSFDSYEALWIWSTGNLEDFWQSIWDYFGVQAHAQARSVLASRDMPGARWFPGATLNYAEHALADSRDGDSPALVFVREDGLTETVSREQLRERQDHDLRVLPAGRLGHEARALQAVGDPAAEFGQAQTPPHPGGTGESQRAGGRRIGLVEL